MFERFDKGKRGRLAQSGDIYMLGRDDVWHLNKVQEPGVNLSLGMNQQRACVLGAACSQGHCELRGTL